MYEIFIHLFNVRLLNDVHKVYQGSRNYISLTLSKTELMAYIYTLEGF